MSLNKEIKLIRKEQEFVSDWSRHLSRRLNIIPLSCEFEVMNLSLFNICCFCLFFFLFFFNLKIHSRYIFII